MLPNSGKLYVVATPIGNLKDMTYRAVEVLKAVDLIACEDTRHARILLDHYGIDRPLTSLFQANEAAKASSLIDRIVEGGNIALISDAGTPNISDPGYRIVEACVKRGVEVVAVPGPSAVVAAMSVSGLPTDAFIFEGFLPVKSGARRNKMESWKSERRTVIFYESPHRIVRALEDIRAVFGDC